MKNFFKIKYLIFISLTLFGCGDNSNKSDIEKIKGGVLKFNTSGTVGRAFDKYKECLSREWIETEDENKNKIIQFNCFLPLDYLMSDKKSEVVKFAVLDMQEKETVMSLSYQFKINKNGTFDIFHTYIIITNKYGLNVKMPIAAIDSINHIYKNEPFLDR